MAVRAQTHDSLLQSPVRRQLLGELNLYSGTAGRTAAELAVALELHVTTVRFHLDQLVASGLVVATFVRGTGAGRPSKRYAPRVTHVPDLSPPQPYQELAELLASNFPKHAGDYVSPEDAGFNWGTKGEESQRPPAATSGAWLAKVGTLVDKLRGWGYVPELKASEGGRTVEISMSACPYAAVAREHQDVVCAAHVGLLRGVLASLGETDVDVDVKPFVEPALCKAWLSTNSSFTTQGAR